MKRRRKPKLRPAAQISSRPIADEAWTALMEAGIPATTEYTPRSLGQGDYTRIYVPEADLGRAQDLLAPYVAEDAV